MITLQVTLFDKNKQYRPISTLLKIESMNYYTTHTAEVQKRALMNIAHNRKTTPQELIKQGYTKIKTREYDVEKIKEQEEFRHKVNLIKKMYRDRQEKSK